jgi:hypothetical protein
MLFSESPAGSHGDLRRVVPGRTECRGELLVLCLLQRDAAPDGAPCRFPQRFPLTSPGLRYGYSHALPERDRDAAEILGRVISPPVDLPPPRICSIGYEGLTLDEFISRLKRERVRTVVDVRLTPASRRPGFSKKSLSKALSDVGIGYVHEKDLGNPADNREVFKSREPEEGRLAMRERLENGSGDALRRLVELSRTERVAVLCVERFSANCHRQVIIEMAREIEPLLEVVEIW